VRIPLLSFVVLVFLLVVGCSSSSEPEVVATSAQEKPTVLATTSPVPPTSTPQPDVVEQTVEDLLASIERAVEELRGIDTPTPVEHHFVDKAGMQEQLAELLDDPETIEQIAHESALFKLLGVIPQDADLAGIYDGLFGSQVLGLYDPEKEQFFVLGDDQSGAESIDTEAQLTYAHEYVHRLQDAKFDLETIKELSTGDDMSLAISALIEGDAISAQSQYILANYDFAELGELFEAALAAEADLPDSPYFLQKSLEFPYTDGAAFVAVLLQMGNFAAVDAVFADLPKSTEQVLHPEKYLDGELPDELDIPDDALSDVEGSAWSLQAENVLGEFFLKTWLEALGSGNAANAAAGWGGDAYAVFENGPGENALAISIAWDTDLDAKEFIDELSDTFAGNPDYQSRGSGLDGILEAWEGPGGYIVMSRWEVGDGTDMVGVAITPEGGLSHKLNFALATPEGLSQ
jgi:hypothetical protein